MMLPTATPFLYHWNVPLDGFVAVSVMPLPAHIVWAAVTPLGDDIVAASGGDVITMLVVPVAGFPVAQVALDVMDTATT
jgi:hypothetical protein